MSKVKKAPFLSIRVICLMAVFAALEFVLNRILSINTQALKIGFAFVPIVMCAVMLGPVHAAITYAVSDTVGALLFPLGAYMPGITLCCAMMGLVYGLFLKPLLAEDGNRLSLRTAVRVICPVLINCLVFGLIINSYWLSLVYSSRSFGYFFAQRLLEYAVMIPLQIILIPMILDVAKRIRKAGIV